MSHRNDVTEYDEKQLAALARPSASPPALLDDATALPAAEGRVDLTGLRDSIAPPAPPQESAPASNGGAAQVPAPAPVPAEARPVAPAPAPAAPSPVAARAPASAPAASGGGAGKLVVGLLVGLAVGVGAGGALFGGGAGAPADGASGALAGGGWAAGSPPSGTSAQAPSAGGVTAPADGDEDVRGGDIGADDTGADTESDTGVGDTGAGDTGGSARDADRGDTGTATRSAGSDTGDRAAPSGDTGAAAAAPAPTPEPEGAGTAPPRETGSTIDDTLRAALGGGRSPSSGSSGSSLPETPTRDNVASTLGRLRSAVTACAAGQTGVAMAEIIVRSTGEVASVRVTGNPFGGTPQGQCMEGVVRRATFERFSNPTFRVNYPFNVR